MNTKTFKGGAGMAVAAILAWGAGQMGVDIPPEVQAAFASLIGSLIVLIKEKV